MKFNKYLFPSLIFLVSLIVYIITLSPTVSFTDNGELAGVAYFSGIAHSSGYPLLSIISHLWTLIPFGWTVVYQLNVLSAVFAASSAVIFYYTIRLFLENLKILKITESSTKKTKKHKPQKTIEISDSPLSGSIVIEIISIALAFSFAFSSLVWEQAVVFEVYPFQFLLINLSLFLFFKGITSESGEKKFFMLSGLMVGLSFANHLTTVLIIPAVTYLYFKTPGNKFDFSSARVKQMLFIMMMIIAGASIYIYMPVRSMAEPDFNWGYVHRGFDKFLYHVQGKQYQVWMFSGMKTAWMNLGKFISNIPYNLGIIGIIAFFAGLYRLSKSYREFLWFFVILIISCIIYSVNYSIHDIDVYFYLAIYAMIVISAAGFLLFAEKFDKLKYAVILIPLINMGMNYSENDKSDNYLVYDYTRNVVDNLGRDAVIISAQWDYWVSAFWYLQKVENYRPDIVLIEKELLRRTWYPLQLNKWHPEQISQCKRQLDAYMIDLNKFESGMDASEYPAIQQSFTDLLKCFIESNIDKRPVYVTFDYMNSGGDAEPLKGYNIIPVGFAFKLERIQQPFKVSIDNLILDRFIKYPKDTKSHLEKGILEMASMNIVNIGRYAAATSDKVTAEKAYRTALKIWSQNQSADKYLREITR